MEDNYNNLNDKDLDLTKDLESLQTDNKAESEDINQSNQDQLNYTKATNNKYEPIKAIFTDDKGGLEGYPCKGVDSPKTANLYLVLSILGILATVLVFPGIILSIIAFVRANKGLQIQKSQTLTWAFWLGFVGIILNIIVLFSFILYLLI